MEVNIGDSWKRRLQPEFDKPYFYNLTNLIYNYLTICK